MIKSIDDSWFALKKVESLLHKELLKYAVENNKGSISSLNQIFTKEIVEGAIILGHLKQVLIIEDETIDVKTIGFDDLKQGWQITENGKNWYEIIYVEELYRPTIFERFVNWSNKMIMKL